MGLVTDFELQYTFLEDITPPAAAIVVAAGNATRMGGSKQLLPLCGIPVLARSIIAFQNCNGIRDIVVVAREEEIADIQRLLDAYSLTKVTALVAGGQERCDSVEQGVLALAPDVAYIAIHDGARPMIQPEQIEDVLYVARQRGAAALAVPVKNTIKRVSVDGCILETLPRPHLVAMQTPQVFDIDIYKKALKVAKEQNVPVTDDCQICELAGFPVFTVTGAYENIKITTPEDMITAEGFLTRGDCHD